MKNFSFLFAFLLCWPLGVHGTPRHGSAVPVVSEQTKAATFLDGVVASYRSLHSLSVGWHSKAHLGQGVQTGTFWWRHARPAQVRFENKTTGYRMISDGKRAFWSGGGVIPRFRSPVAGNTIGDVSLIETDEMTPFLLSGQNPLRAPVGENAQSGNDLGTYAADTARVLGFAAINGVRCRGVRIQHQIEGRNATTTVIYTLWFDRHNLLRRAEKNDSGADREQVDFMPRANVKLADSLFLVRTN